MNRKIQIHIVINSHCDLIVKNTLHLTITLHRTNPIFLRLHLKLFSFQKFFLSLLLSSCFTAHSHISYKCHGWYAFWIAEIVACVYSYCMSHKLLKQFHNHKLKGMNPLIDSRPLIPLIFLFALVNIINNRFAYFLFWFSKCYSQFHIQ